MQGIFFQDVIVINIFKSAQIKEYTSHDLNAKCVCIDSKNKRELKRICTRKARKKLKNEMLKTKGNYE